MIHCKTLIVFLVCFATFQISAGFRSARVRRQAEENGTIGIMPISATLDNTTDANNTDILITAMPVDIAVENTADNITLNDTGPIFWTTGVQNETLDNITITAVDGTLDNSTIVQNGSVPILTPVGGGGGESGGASGGESGVSVSTSSFVRRVKSAYCSPTEIEQTNADFRALIITTLGLDEASAADLTLKQLKIRYIIYLIDSDSLLGECFADLRDKLANLDE